MNSDERIASSLSSIAISLKKIELDLRTLAIELKQKEDHDGGNAAEQKQ